MSVTLLLLTIFFPLTAIFGDIRTYVSKDGEKTFRGELIEYEASTKKAKMRIARGKVLTFPIEILSKQDQKYLEEQGPIVQAKKALSIDTKHYSKRTEKNKPTIVSEGNIEMNQCDHEHQIISMSMVNNSNWKKKYCFLTLLIFCPVGRVSFAETAKYCVQIYHKETFSIHLLCDEINICNLFSGNDDEFQSLECSIDWWIFIFQLPWMYFS